MKKSAKTKEILNEWRNFENRNLNESQGAAVRLRPKPSQRALDLKKKLEDKFGVGPFYDYSNFDHFGDDEMISNYGHGDEGIQAEYQEVADFVNSTGEIEISDMDLGDFVTAEDDLFYEHGKSARDLNITKAGIANLPSGEYAEFGFVELDDGERIPVVYTTSHGYTIYRFIPVEYDAPAQPAKTFKSSLGGAWD